MTVSAHGTAPVGKQAISTMSWYPNQPHYLDHGPTSYCPIRDTYGSILNRDLVFVAGSNMIKTKKFPISQNGGRALYSFGDPSGRRRSKVEYEDWRVWIQWTSPLSNEGGDGWPPLIETNRDYHHMRNKENMWSLMLEGLCNYWIFGLVQNALGRPGGLTQGTYYLII